jgi:hypothetical protein
MVLKGCWYFLVFSFFASLAVAAIGSGAWWLIAIFVVTFIASLVYMAKVAPQKQAQNLALQQVRVAQQFGKVLPLDLVEEARTAPLLVGESGVDGWAIDTDGYTAAPISETALELTLVCQSAANAGTNTVLVALGQVVIGKVKSDQLEELYQAVMSAGGVARCMGTISEEQTGGASATSANSKVEIDVAKPFGLIKGQ